MPERAFVYQDVPTLKKTAAALEKALQTGQITDMQISGIRTTTGQMGQANLKLAYTQCRYEIFARGAGLHGFSADPECAELEPRNPWQERVMRVESVHY